MPDDSIDTILQLPQRKLVVSQNDVYLDRQGKNEIFVLMVEESRGSAGGRAAGSGHRKVDRVYGFPAKAAIAPNSLIPLINRRLKCLTSLTAR